MGHRQIHGELKHRRQSVQSGLGFKSNEGSFVVSWTSDGRTAAGRASSRSGSTVAAGRIGSEFQVNSVTDGNQDHSSVTVDKNTGDFLITWSSDDQDSWDVYSQLYTADGTAYGPAIRVNTTTEGSQTNSSATFLSSTSYAVVWSGNGVGDDSGVYSAVCDTTLLRPANLAPVNIVPGDPERQREYAGNLLGGQRQRDPGRRAWTRIASLHQVTLSVDNGTLTLSRHQRPDVQRRRQRQQLHDLHGHAGRHQRGLERMQYVPTVDFTGTDNLQITTNDLASILAGGPKTDADTVAINVSDPSSYSGLLGIYYNNLDATGTPVYRVDPTVNFDWGNQGSPASGIQGTNWSASWQGQVLANDSGMYTFYATGGRRRSPLGQRSIDVRRLELPGRHHLFGHDLLGGRAVVLDPHGLFPGRRGRNGQTRMGRRAGRHKRQVISHRSPQLREPSPERERGPGHQRSRNANRQRERGGRLSRRPIGNAITVADADSYQNQPLAGDIVRHRRHSHAGKHQRLELHRRRRLPGCDDDVHGLVEQHQRRSGRAEVPADDGQLRWDRQPGDHRQRPGSVLCRRPAKPLPRPSPSTWRCRTEFQGLLGTYYNNYDGVDLALGKTATQSSDPWGYPASNAVDGNLNNFSHTYYNDGSYQPEIHGGKSI